MYRAWYASLSASQVGLCNFPAYLKPLTRKYFSKRTLEVLKVPSVSISITVLKALKDRELAGHRKFPAAPRNKAGARSARGQETSGSSGTSGGTTSPLCCSQGLAPSLPGCSQSTAVRQRQQTQPTCQPSPPQPRQLTINQDVDALELSQRLVHRSHDGLRLPDVYGQGQALLPRGCHQLF